MDKKPENMPRPAREDDNRKILLLPETRMETLRAKQEEARVAEAEYHKRSRNADEAMREFMENNASLGEEDFRASAYSAVLARAEAEFHMRRTAREEDFLREETGEMIRLYNVARAGVFVAMMALGGGSEGEAPDRVQVDKLLDELDADFVENGPPKSDDYVAVGRQLLGLIKTE